MNLKKGRIKPRLALCLLGVVGLIVAFSAFNRERYWLTLSDGSILSIQALGYGETNTLIQGSGLERAWARLSPWLGTKVPGFTLPLPTTNYVSEYGPNLAFLLQLKHPSKTNLLLDHDLRTRAKVILFTEKGAEYSGFLTEFSTHGDSHYAHCSTHAFPRQKRFWIRLELMEGGDRWSLLSSPRGQLAKSEEGEKVRGRQSSAEIHGHLQRSLPKISSAKRLSFLTGSGS